MSLSDAERFIVGIDLSLTGTGLAEYDLDDGQFLTHTYGTKGKKTDTYAMRGTRLADMADYIVDWITAGDSDPVLAVIEGPSYGSVNGSQHDRSGLWWLVTSGLQAEDIPVLVVAPRTRAKYATGSGAAKKDVVLAHVVEQYADVTESRIANDNEADALTLAAMGARYWGEPQEESLPESNLLAMDGIEAM